MIASHTLVRNAEDTIEDALMSVYPYVDKLVVCVDSNSSDNTREVLLNIQDEKFIIFECKVTNPLKDLVVARNLMLQMDNEDWMWVVDSDEVYPKETAEEVIEATKHYDTIALYSYAMWDKERYHVSTSKIPSGRVFKRRKQMEWIGTFGKEILYGDGERLWTKPKKELRSGAGILHNRYIHYTHNKKDDWRSELHLTRRADNRNLRKL